MRSRPRAHIYFLSGKFYLSVHKAVERGDEETLEGRDEVRHVGPQRELPRRALERAVDHVDDIGDTQQRQQH
jgi:hypothetical protein